MSASATPAEDVAEHGEDVVHGESAGCTERTAATKSTAWCIETELVVHLPFLRIMQHIVCFGGFLELCLCLRITRIAVGMILDGKFPVCFLYLVF